MRTLTIAIALTGCLLSAASATAADLGTFKDWSAQSVEEGGALVCFMTSAPKILDPGETARASGTVRISVTHRPQDQTFGTVIVETGFAIMAESYGELDIDGNRYFMAAEPEGYLWAPAENEPDIIDAFKGGKEVVVTVADSEGKPISDIYSLSGFSAALKAITDACPKP